MRAACLLLLPLFAWTALAAQPQDPAAPGEEPLTGRHSQKIERIRIEDNGARIDELRVGGQTRSITVQPKANLPEYEFQSSDLSRSSPADTRDGLSSPGNQRVWNLFRF